MKILNLYAGIGGNRELWGDSHDITSIEINSDIAQIYKGKFPNDTVIVADAHQYLLEHYKEFDFIWSSPPCPAHSRMRNLKNNCEEAEKKYPDMKLYEEIIFLKHFFKGKFCVENVISYYEPLIKPQESNNHYFWCNFLIEKQKNVCRHIRGGDTMTNNMVEPKLALMILNYAFKITQLKL